MAIPSRQIGWGTEENLLWQISKQLEQLTGVTSKVSGGGGSYLKYTAVLGQMDEDAPQVIVLENTIGDIVWTRQSTGAYIATLVGAFPENKTWCSAISGANYGNTTVLFFTRDTDDILRLLSKDLTTGSDQDINSNDGGNLVYECSIEIRVYP